MTEADYSGVKLGNAQAWIDGIADEFREGFETLADIGPAISIFGSARLGAESRYYQAAEKMAGLAAGKGKAVITGGGPGIMEAANRGAKLAGGRSVGLGIELPHEQGVNEYVDTSITFKHFFVRKTMFLQHSQGIIICPGGFGTFDEMFETLTMIQTRKAPRIPIALYEGNYWRDLFDWLDTTVMNNGMISPLDPQVVRFTDDVAEAVDIVTTPLAG